MEIQNAVNPAPGGSGLTGKPGGGAAEMRSAFEAMMGALLGLLNPAPTAPTALPAYGSPAAGESVSPPRSLESLFAQISGKSAPALPAPLAAPPVEEAAAPPMPLTGQAAAEEGAATPSAGYAALPLPRQAAQTAQAIPPTFGAGNPPGDPAGITGQTPAAQMKALAPDEGGQPADTRPAPPAPAAPFASALGAAQEQNTAGKANPTGAAPAPAIAPTPAEQISEQVRVRLGQGEQDATIQLNPKALGSVRIRLQMENGRLHLSIRAEQAETGRLLDGKLAELRHSLESQGIRVGELAVARSERVVGGEGLGRDVAPASRAGPMDMNANDASSQRQAAAFAGGGSNGGNPTGQQHAPGQQPGLLESPALGGRDRRGEAEGRPAGVDYYA